MSYTTLFTATGTHRLALRLANTFFSRFRGLMFQASLPSDHALLITECSSVHSCFMRFPIDVIYLNQAGIIVQCTPHLKPWRSRFCMAAAHVLELEAGSITRLNIQVGDQLKHPYFQVARTCLSLHRPIPARQQGSAMLEFALAAPVITLLGLATLQYGLLFFAKNQLNHAAFMAARAGSMGNAQLNTVTDTYIKALIPLYGGGRTTDEIKAALKKASEDVSGHTQIQLLNPTKESFDDWSNSALQAKLGTKGRVIPFASQQFKDAGDIRAHSGQNILDANILKIRITHGYLPKVPLMRSIYTMFMKWYDPHTDTFQSQLMNEGRIPVVTSITLHMQSDAIESDSSISVPGMGNNGKPTDPGIPNSANPPAPNCPTIGCTVENRPPPPKLTPSDPEAGGLDGGKECSGSNCPACRVGII